MVNRGAGVSNEHQPETSWTTLRAAPWPCTLRSYQALKPLDRSQSVVILNTCKRASATGLASFVQQLHAGLPLWRRPATPRNHFLDLHSRDRTRWNSSWSESAW
jgi:hypothetical protein